MKTKTGIILPDTHFRPARDGQPTGEDSQVLRKLVLPFMRERRKKIDFVVHLGDLVDLPTLSRYESHLDTDEAVELALQDYKYTRSWLPELLEEAPNARWYILEGNHDFRAKSYCSTKGRRHLVDALDLPSRLEFRKYPQISWIPYWTNKRRVVRIGKAMFVHGLSVAKNHMNVMADKYPGTNLYYGHTHDHQSRSPIIYDSRAANEVMSMGMLCRFDQPYRDGSPDNWRQGFGEMTLFGSGYYSMEYYSIFGGKFTSGGKVYNARVT